MEEIDYNDLFYYSPESKSGLIWKSDRWCGRNMSILRAAKGECAGHIASDGYWKIKIAGRFHAAHRIIWKILYGLPEDICIDHIDRDRSNNSLNNLRAVSARVNTQNHPLREDNKTGVCGVHYSEGKWPCYQATWRDSDNKSRAASFSVNKYGKDEAFRLACERRKKAIEDLNTEGQNYHESHGYA
jgi:hypothetical protein